MPEEARLVIRHREDLVRQALFLMIALSPLWCGWPLYVSSWLSVAVYQGVYVSGILGYADLCALLVFYLLLIAAGSFATFVCLNNKLVITPQGIRVPWRLLFEMGLVTQRPWKDLHRVWLKDGLLVLNFEQAQRNTGNAIFSLGGFKSSDLKDFLLAVHSNSPTTRCEFDPKLLDLNLPKVNRVKDDLSFTSIWEKDLVSRFGSTAFVPLEAGMSLQGGLLKVIGQMSFGGLSAVYLCKNKTQETVVLKEAVVPLNADKASREKALDLFKRETHILKGLAHPNIARVLDHFVENDHDYLVLEHIDGMDLRAYVKEHGPQSERVVLRWAAEIADILRYLHEHDPPIVHRDVTPDNLVIDRTGKLKLIDFGAANEFVGTATGTLIGKQSYISPEQFRGKAVPQSDIYSLGCTLYYLATGDDPEALSQSSLPEEQGIAKPRLDALIKACTGIELSERLKSMTAVRDMSEASTTKAGAEK